MNSEYTNFMFFYICILSCRNQTASKYPSNPPPLLPNFPPGYSVGEAKVIPFMLG